MVEPLRTSFFKKTLKGEKLIEGWIEGPCAEAADLRGINNLMLGFFDDPQFVHDLSEFVLARPISFYVFPNPSSNVFV